ncbi:urease accessory protein [Rufibacter hautae]|uniref:Urease accessory protein n=1 Tax=Rufibacter hautae TaxID=2595005 RepID=A0A5B6TBB1_9BACT|nr:urease accessory protein [Rufibacter hautae]KAA3436304.1 urease accessory protein [Rufibacter hautae]
MQTLMPLMFASLVGMGHAFEADHLIAVGNIVSKRDSWLLAMKDGLYWGLGHTTTIVLLGSLIILSQVIFLHSTSYQAGFGYFEAGVGLMLVVMGISRLTNKQNFSRNRTPRYQHSYAYTVGLIHGLAGSGALVVSIMGKIEDPWLGVAYLVMFGVGSILGMFVAAGLVNIPFTQRMKIGRNVRMGMVLASSVLCVAYGGWMMYENLLL